MATPAVAASEAGRDPEALAVYVILAVVGAVRLSVALALGEAIGPESTVALAMVVAAAIGVLRRAS